MISVTISFEEYAAELKLNLANASEDYDENSVNICFNEMGYDKAYKINMRMCQLLGPSKHGMRTASSADNPIDGTKSPKSI